MVDWETIRDRPDEFIRQWQQETWPTEYYSPRWLIEKGSWIIQFSFFGKGV